MENTEYKNKVYSCDLCDHIIGNKNYLDNYGLELEVFSISDMIKVHLCQSCKNAVVTKAVNNEFT